MGFIIFVVIALAVLGSPKKAAANPKKKDMGWLALAIAVACLLALALGSVHGHAGEVINNTLWHAQHAPDRLFGKHG